MNSFYSIFKTKKTPKNFLGVFFHNMKGTFAYLILHRTAEILGSIYRLKIDGEYASNYFFLLCVRKFAYFIYDTV